MRRRYIRQLVWLFIWATIGLFLLGLLGSMRNYQGTSTGMNHVHASEAH